MGAPDKDPIEEARRVLEEVYEREAQIVKKAEEVIVRFKESRLALADAITELALHRLACMRGIPGHEGLYQMIASNMEATENFVFVTQEMFDLADERIENQKQFYEASAAYLHVFGNGISPSMN